MHKLDREIIHIMSRNGSLKPETLEELLVQHVHPDRKSWQQFIKLLLLILGIGFFTAGVLFFFAYNWDSLHKFAKMGIIELLLVGVMIPVLFTKISLLVKHSLLSAASILVGILFAVYGQIYQTGANAYDFFFGWTIFVTLWVLVSNFPLLWLIYIVLIYTTIGLYLEQVAHEMQTIDILFLYFAISVLFILAFKVVQKFYTWFSFPRWLEVVLAIAGCIAATEGISYGIHEEQPSMFGTLVLVTIAMYIVGIWNAFQTKHVFYLAIIPFSVIVILFSLFLKISNDEGMLFFLSLFVIGSVTATILFILKTHKRWNHVEE